MSSKIRALCLHEKDNVATLLMNAQLGETIILKGPNNENLGILEAVESISRGHKVAVQEILSNSNIIKYGEIIGQSIVSIRKGTWVHTHNLESLRGRGDKDE